MIPGKVWRRTRSIRWIHPSYRDLVINELVQDEKLRLQFLSLMDLEGIKIAVSQAGGATGDRRLPLMGSEKSWEMLQTRCLFLINTSEPNVGLNLLRVLRSAALDATAGVKCKLTEVLATCCDAVRQSWDEKGITLKAEQLKDYFEASIAVETLPVSPQLGPSWRSAYSDFKKAVSDVLKNSVALDEGALLEWARLTAVIRDNEPRYLKQIKFPETFESDLTELLRIVEEECAYVPDSGNPDDLWSEAERFETIAKALEALVDLFPKRKRSVNGVLSKVTAHENEVRGLYYREAPDEDEPDYDPVRESSDSFDVDSLFCDL